MFIRYILYVKNSSKGSINTAILSLVLSCISSFSFADEDSAYDHIYEVMDSYHQSFDVYTDLSAAGNHFVTLGRMTSIGDDDNGNPVPEVVSLSGFHCARIFAIVEVESWKR